MGIESLEVPQVEVKTKSTDDHSSLIIGGLGAVLTSVFSYVPETKTIAVHLNLADPMFWGGAGMALHGFGINVPVFDQIFGFVASMFLKK